MNFFKQYFKEYDFDSNEVAVRCPFSHKDENGNEYYENVPSAHVNLDKGTFHCKVCNEGYSETKFLSKVNGISYKDARILISKIDKQEFDSNWTHAEEMFKYSNSAKKFVKDLGITENVSEELRLGYEGGGVSFPVFMYGELLDVRKYDPNNKPKIQSRKGSQSNLIVPFDIWVDDNRPTFLMAGEKDMALARSLGYNAITFTGGEGAWPKLFKASFKNRKIFIVYDNDEAGKKGARKVAALLKESGAIPFVVEGHHETCVEKGEDFWDYIMLYGKSKEDFDALVENTKEFTDNDFQVEKEKIFPTVKLLDATKGKYRNKFIRSSVQVTATFDSTFGIPDYVEIEKVAANSKSDLMEVGEKREWSLSDQNIEDILLLMDSKLKDEQVEKNIKEMCGVKNEKGVKIKKLSYDTVFKATVTDLVESDVMKEDYKQPLELVVYTVGLKLESGRKYKLTYKIVPHPLQQQEMVMLVTNIEQSDDTVTTFKVTDQVKESLKVFQGNVYDKMSEIYDRSKGLIGAFANESIVHAIDLTYHTPLEFKFGRHKIRGVIDSMIVGESRTGKSASAIKLLETYELGTFSSLKNSTVAGLVGGSNKVQGTFKTTIGTIPRNHKGMVVFEEFSGADPKFIKAITDIRSSGEVRLTRVNGELHLPANLRMLTISNQKTNGEGFSKPLRNYPSGVEVLVELIGAAEDIARYDFFVLVGEPSEYDDPLAIVEEPFEKESYKNRVRWVWSRKTDQVKFDTGVDRYIVDRAKELNSEFNTHVKFFGSEAYKKLAKISVAVAGCVVSTDDTFNDIIVKKEHVDWAVDFLKSLYDNELFRLKQYVQEQRRYSEVDNDVIEKVQELYANHNTLLSQMETTSAISSKNLQAVSGLEPKDFSAIMNILARYMLFQWQGDKVVPSERFRKSMAAIDRNSRVKQPGEIM